MSYFKELSHCQIVQSVGTVEHHALHGESFSEIFGGLCLACEGKGWGGRDGDGEDGEGRGRVISMTMMKGEKGGREGEV